MKIKGYFTKVELTLYFSSLFLIIGSFIIFDGKSYLTLVASVIGATSLIFTAKGNPIGQFLMIVFGVLYGVISLSQRYYGELITYVGMTVPMAVFSLISWLKNPYEKDKSEVKVNAVGKAEYCFTFIAGLAVAGGFYFILKAFNTANIIPSTISVATSFFGVYLTFRRSPYFALGYMANDIVLIILWTLASLKSVEYLSVVICFTAFLVNDFYTFYNWERMRKKQKKNKNIDNEVKKIDA